MEAGGRRVVHANPRGACREEVLSHVLHVRRRGKSGVREKGKARPTSSG